MAPISGEGAFCWVPQIYLLLVDQLSLRFKSSDVFEFLIPDLMAEMKKKTSPKCRFIRKKMSYFKKELFMYFGISLQIMLDPFYWCLFHVHVYISNPKLFNQSSKIIPPEAGPRNCAIVATDRSETRKKHSKKIESLLVEPKNCRHRAWPLVTLILRLCFQRFTTWVDDDYHYYYYSHRHYYYPKISQN